MKRGEERGSEVKRNGGKREQAVTAGSLKTHCGVNGPHLVPSQNAEKTDNMMYTHIVSLKHTLPLHPSLSLGPFCLTSPGWPHCLFQDPPKSSRHDLQEYISDQFNVRKYEVGEPQ